ncbi:MAG: aldo/keto reductase [Thermoguttaceae bacterium]|jgi:predicted aldo/keto reductase-like oxidoreductase
MSTLSRRQFLARTSLALGAAALAPRLAAAAPARKITSGADIVTLGRTGIKTSLLGIGTGMNGVGRSSNQMKLGASGFTRLLRYALERGIRYIDSADQYGSHLFIREALKGVDRSKLMIQTKTLAHHPEVAKADIERFRQELGMDCLDTLLLHCMQTRSWPADMRPVMDVLSDAKEKGRVRAVGVSCHGWDPLEASIACRWIDVQLARINPFGAIMDAAPEQVSAALKKMHAGGRGVIGMKICGGGTKTGAEDRLKSLKYVLGLGCVDCLAIGFESTKQIDEVLEQIETVAREL